MQLDTTVQYNVLDSSPGSNQTVIGMHGCAVLSSIICAIEIPAKEQLKLI